MGWDVDRAMWVALLQQGGARTPGGNVGGLWADRELHRAWFLELGPYALASMSGGRDELRRVVDPEFADLIEDLQPREAPDAWIERPVWTTAGADVAGSAVWFRIDDRHGHACRLLHSVETCSGDVPPWRVGRDRGLGALGTYAVRGASRSSPVAILMADLEASSPLARRLSTAQYFAFSRRLVRDADRCIIDAGGIVGRHTGDGVVAFFLAEQPDRNRPPRERASRRHESCGDSLAGIATRSGIPEPELSLRFGLHWGATPVHGPDPHRRSSFALRRPRDRRAMEPDTNEAQVDDMAPDLGP